MTHITGMLFVWFGGHDHVYHSDLTTEWKLILDGAEIKVPIDRSFVPEISALVKQMLCHAANKCPLIANVVQILRKYVPHAPDINTNLSTTSNFEASNLNKNSNDACDGSDNKHTSTPQQRKGCQ